jgi:hypothetical protein
VRPSKPLSESIPDIFDRQDVLSFLVLANLSIVLVPAFITAVLLLLRIRTPWIEAQLGLGVALLGLFWIYLRGLPKSRLSVVLAVFSVPILVAAFAASYIYDVGWDGITYHSEAILGLLNGINPIYKSFEGNFPLWTDHYPKTEWYFAASIGGAFHLFEIGKSYNFFLLYACGFYSWRFFRGLRLDRTAALLLASGTALNPIAASQLFSFYVDGAMASLCSILVISSVAQLQRPARLDRVVFIAAAAAVFTTKFTGAAYVCVTLGLIFATLIFVSFTDSFSRKIIAIKAMTVTTAWLCVVTLLLGFSPYVTNLLGKHNLFYPAAGKDRVEVITEKFAPLASQDRFQNLAVSLFSESKEAHGTESPILKIPFSIHLSEIRDSTTPDLRIAGWGVLFSGILVVSLALYVYTHGWRVPAISFMVLVVLATSFSNPYAYWARLTPQIAMLPILLLVPSVTLNSRKVGIFAKGISVLFVLNSLLPLALTTGNSLRGTRRANDSLRNIYQQCGPGEYWFDGNNILIRYDMLPPYRGVSIHFRRATENDLSSGVSLPFNMLKGITDTVHISHCNVPGHP